MGKSTQPSVWNSSQQIPSICKAWSRRSQDSKIQMQKTKTLLLINPRVLKLGDGVIRSYSGGSLCFASADYRNCILWLKPPWGFTFYTTARTPTASEFCKFFYFLCLLIYAYMWIVWVAVFAYYICVCICRGQRSMSSVFLSCPLSTAITNMHCHAQPLWGHWGSKLRCSCWQQGLQSLSHLLGPS